MATALSMAAMAFLITIVLGSPYLNYLRRAGFGKKVRIEGPSTHIEKTGTPTMGGLLVSTVVLGLTVCLTLILYRESGRSILLPMGVMALTTLLGLYDDRMTLVGRKGEGMRARTKFALLAIIALAASFVLWDKPTGLGIDFVYLPGVKAPFSIGWLVIPLSVLAVMGSGHPVNLTDGLDSPAGHTAGGGVPPDGRPRRHAGHRGDDARPGAAAVVHRLRVRGRSLVGHAPGGVLQADPRAAAVPDGAAAPPLRDDGLERDAGRPAVL